jgi:hypothetical protein
VSWFSGEKGNSFCGLQYPFIGQAGLLGEQSQRPPYQLVLHQPARREKLIHTSLVGFDPAMNLCLNQQNQGSSAGFPHSYPLSSVPFGTPENRPWGF